MNSFPSRPVPPKNPAPPISPDYKPGSGRLLARFGVITQSQQASRPAATSDRSAEIVSPALSAPKPAAETEFDEEGRLIISAPLQPPARPVPTIIHPNPVGARTMSEILNPLGPPSSVMPPPRAPAPKIEAKPTVPATPALPRVSMMDAGKFPTRQLAREQNPEQPTKIHKGYMGRRALIDPEEIPF
jgi:hypothetical protein